MGLLNPALLWFAIGGSIPIIIHLLHRQKFRRVRWAAMEFLLAALRKTQRRLQIENLILLMLRVLIMILLAMAIARPFFKESPLEALAESDTHHILVIDVSYSMGYKKGQRSALELAREAADQQLGQIRKLTEQDKVSILLMSTYPEDFLPASNKLDWVKKSLGDIRLSHYGSSALLTFQKVLDLVKRSRNQQKRVTLFTDLQRGAWEPGEEPEVKKLQALLAELSKREDVRLQLVDVGADQADNRAVVDLRVEQKIVAVRKTTNFAVDVQNWSNSSYPSVAVTLYVDGVALPQKSVPLPGQSLITVNFTHEFLEPGPHFVEAGIEPDFLDVDDRRYLALDVRDGLRGLLIDGEPGSERWTSETDFLKTALDPSGQGRFFKLDIKTPDLFTGELLEGYDFVALCNVQSLTQDRVDKLESYVAGGGGLFISLGGRVSHVSWNELFWKEGRGLLPCQLVEVGGTGPDVDPRIPLRMSTIDFQHPIFRVFHKGLQHAPRDLLFYQHWKVDRLGDRAHVISNLDDATGSPLFVEQTFGEGRVILLTSTIDADWTESWTGRPPYLPIVRSAMEHLSSRPSARKNLLVGELLQHSLTTDQYQPTFVLEVPIEGQISISPTAPSPEEKFVRIFYPLRRQERKPEAEGPVENDGLKYAGRYKLDPGERRDDDKPLSYFACNLPPRTVSPEALLRSEGNLERIGVEELRRRYADFKFELIGEKKSTGEVDLDQRDPSHLWKILLYLVAGMLVLEAILGWLFGKAKQ